jgi:hypothetical protein
MGLLTPEDIHALAVIGEKKNLYSVLKDQDTTAGLATIARLGTRIVVAANQVVQPVTAGALASTYTVKAPDPGTSQVGCLVSFELSFSLERILSMVVVHEGQAVIGEAKATSGEKKPASMWFPFTQNLSLTVGNPSVGFSVITSIFAIFYYLDRSVYLGIVKAAGDIFGQARMLGKQ